MRLIKIQYLLLAFASFYFASCEDVVTLPVDETPELVVFSNFSDQDDLDGSSHQGLQVYISKTRSILTDDTTEIVKNAVVKVYADGQLLEDLQFFVPQKGIPFYTTNHLIPVFDKEYTIVVDVEGYETITAKNSIPTPVNIEDVSFTPQVSPGKGDDVMVNFYTSVSLRDPAGIENFYHIKFYQEFSSFTLDESNDTVFTDTFLVFPSNVDKIDENSPPTKYDKDQSYLIKDTGFDGQYITLNFTGQYTFNPTTTKPGRFLIELRTVSKAYFLYHQSLNRQFQTNGHVGEGEVVFNNIDNGVGNFSGFTSKVNSFRLTN